MRVNGKLRINFILAILFPLILFSYIGVRRVISHFPAYDDAYNATVAKNFAAGYGYTTSYNSIIQFNPEITTGPNLILPAALLMKLLGNKYWVPAFSILLISCLSLLTILYFVYKHMKENSIINSGKKMDWIILSLYFLFVVLFWIPDIRGIEFLGELPSALFICSGILVLFLPYHKNLNIFLGGFLLGLAITSKFVSLIFVIPIQFMWLLFLSDEMKHKLMYGIKSSQFLLTLGIILPTLLFEFWKLITYGFEKFYAISLGEILFFSNTGSGVNQIMYPKDDFFNYIFRNLQNHLQVLQSTPDGIFRFYVYLACLLIVFTISIIKAKNKKSFSTLDRLTLTSFVSITAYMLWWLFLSSQAWYRHVFPAIVVMSFGIIISMLTLFRKWALPAIFLIFLLWILVYPTQWSGIFEKSKIPAELMSATQDTSDFLLKEKEEGKVLLGCGWWANRRLELFMPDVLNFHDCFSNTWQNSDLVIDQEFWNWDGDPKIYFLEKQCDQLIFDKFPYRVFQCNNRDMTPND